jgi:hypothetical protein
LYIWEEVHKEKTPEGPNGGGNDDNSDDNGDGDDSGDNGGDLAMTTLSGYIRCVVRLAAISELYASVDECFQAMEALMRTRSIPVVDG